MIPLPHAPNLPIRLLIADDSPTVRAVLRAMLPPDDEIVVVGEAVNGLEALRMVPRLRPDVVLMDIAMPVMDGVEATERIMATCAVPIIAFSSLTRTDETRASIDVLAAGALDVMGKPDLPDEEALAACSRLLRRKIRIASKVVVVHRHRGRTPAEDSQDLTVFTGAARKRYAAVGIGASAGGPAALRELLSRLPAGFPLPVLVVQHMTPGFTAEFVEWLRQFSPLPVRLAKDGDLAPPGTVLLAPEGRHMAVGIGRRVSTVPGPPKRMHLPSVDVLFASMAATFGGRGIGILMTGMGADGVEGLIEMQMVGALTIAQDEASCAVFGMPGEAVRRGAAEKVLSPEATAALLNELSACAAGGAEAGGGECSLS